jgi:hypothetical protein
VPPPSTSFSIDNGTSPSSRDHVVLLP